jgi:hypothetical protein
MANTPAKPWCVQSGRGTEEFRSKRAAEARAREIATDPHQSRPAIYRWAAGRWHLHEGWGR